MNAFAWMAKAKEAAKAGGMCPRASVACDLYSSTGAYVAGATNGRVDGPCNCNTDATDTLVSAGSSCLALHSEIAAVLKAARLGGWNHIHTAVVTRAPCRNCLAALLASPCQLIVCSAEWPDRDGTRVMWEAQGRKWLVID